MGLKDLGNLIYGTIFGGTVLPPQHKKSDGSWVETGENDPLPIEVTGSNLIQPVDVQGRLTQLIQTQAGVTILPNAFNYGSWIDSHVDGSPLTYLGVTASMTSGTGMAVVVDYSHDNGSTVMGSHTLYDSTLSLFATGSKDYPEIQLPARYFRIAVKNKDASNPKTTSANAYLKA